MRSQASYQASHVSCVGACGGAVTLRWLLDTQSINWWIYCGKSFSLSNKAIIYQISMFTARWRI